MHYATTYNNIRLPEFNILLIWSRAFCLQCEWLLLHFKILIVFNATKFNSIWLIDSDRFWTKINKLDKIEIKVEICNKWSIVLAIFTNFMIDISTCIVHYKKTTAQHNANEIIVIGKQFNSFYFIFALCFALSSRLFTCFIDQMNDCNWEMAKGPQFMANKSHWLNTSIKN